mgnify:CR=1 FL=1
MELFVEFGAGRKLTLFGVVKIGIKNFQRAVAGEEGDKRNRVVLPCRLLVGANIACRQQGIPAAKCGQEVGNGFQCMMRATASVENVKRKNVTTGRSDVLTSDVERLLQMGGKGRFRPEILAVHPRVDDQTDVVDVNTTLLAEFHGQALQGLHQRFFLDVLGPC